MSEQKPAKDYERDIDEELAQELKAGSPSKQRIQELVIQGANVNAVDCDNESVLMTAIEYLSPYGGGVTLDILRQLIALGADVNYAMSDGDGTLFEAFLSHSPEAMELLLESGASPNIIIEGLPMLDVVEVRLDYQEANKPYSEPPEAFFIPQLQQMIKILKRYGAKSLKEIRASEGLK